VQGLRAAAALAVAFSHFAHDAIIDAGGHAVWLSAVAKFFPWDAGVDIFFVISGFVIVHASAPLFATRRGPRTFMHHRFARIVPLYWIMTASFLAVLAGSRAAIHGDIGGPGFIAASLCFIPWPRPDGVMQPAFGLGWTLNYEMFFYMVFAPFLLLRRGLAVCGATVLLAGFVALGLLHPYGNLQLAYWASPIILEFCAGMLLAQAYAAGFRLPLPLRVLLAAAAFVFLHLGADATSLRPLTYGVPALLLVGACVLAPPFAAPRTAKVLVILGDASYAMYLVHPFIMRGLTVLWHKFHAHGAFAVPIYVLAGLAVAQCCALAINRYLERKLTRRLRPANRVTDEALQMPGLRADGIL
jgi:peptidoglycan/LPS O-acetylase OafA/YrhL